MNHSIDIAKGLGILAVIIGHIILDDHDGNYFRFVIYGFHMPLFFYVSGWLTNPGKLADLSFKGFLCKYGKRMLPWWFAALVFYNLVVAFFTHPDTSPAAILNLIVEPFYHLWFIPGLFCTILLYWLLTRYTSLSRTTAQWCLLALGTVTFVLALFEIIPTTFFIRRHNILYFALGLLCKSYNKGLKANVLCLPLLFLICASLIHFNITEYRGVYMQITVVTLFALLLNPIFHNDVLKPNRDLEWLGRNSLQIYLWHVAPIMALKQVLGSNSTLYYCISFSILLLSYLGLTVCLRRKNP